MIPSLKYKDIYFGGIILLAIGLPTSMFLMSIAQFILMGNWIAEGRIKEKLQIFFKNTIALSIVSIFFLHLIGLLHTTNFNYALDDLRIKLPILILPLLFSTFAPLSAKQFYIVLYFFIASIVVGTAIGMYRYMHINAIDNTNIRDLITSVSHIRFGLMLSLSIFILGKFIIDEKSPVPHSLAIKLLFTAIIIWFTTFLFLMEAMTGIIISLSVIMVLIFLLVFKQTNTVYKYTGMALLVSIPLSITACLHYKYNQWFVPKPVDVSLLDKNTAQGNPYQHMQEPFNVENGNYVGMYVCQEELAEEWNKRSNINFDGRDHKNQSLKTTLMRFLTSKGLRKDASGVLSLSADEIKAIENGTANVMYLNKFGFQARIHQLLWEVNILVYNGDPNAHSLLQRIEYVKAAIGLIQQNPLVGVGTGDVPDAFIQYYEETNSRLWPEWRHRAHNQFLSFAIAFGIIGMLWFILVLFYPFYFAFARNNFFFIVFFVIISLSMLSEDTLETQAGVTLFTFFICLFLLSRKRLSSS